MLNWKEQLYRYQSLRRLETEPEKMAEYDRIIELWLEVGRLVDEQ